VRRAIEEERAVAILPDAAPATVHEPVTVEPRKLSGGQHRIAPSTQPPLAWYRRAWWRPRVRDGAVLVGYLLAACWVMGHLATDPTGRVLAANPNDQAFFEWILAYGARVFTDGANPFFTGQLGAPDGVNLMANTSILGLALPLAPLTLLLGVRVTFLLLLIAALTATAGSWYLMLSRRMRLGRGPAFLGASLCGFGPAMVSHANAHPNIVAQFLLPWLLWQLTALARGAPRVRTGVILAGLVLWQFFINEELLFITALGFAVFGAIWLVRVPASRRAVARRLAGGLAVTAAIVVPLLAYPLYVQFFGPQHYAGMTARIHDFGADLRSFYAPASASVGGGGGATRLSQNPSEQNTFFGIPLLVLVGFFGWYLRRRPVVLGLCGTAVVLGVLSLGARLRVAGRLTSIPAPYGLLRDLPLFDSVVPTRLALALTPIAGILVALGCARLFACLPRLVRPAATVPVRLLVAVVLAGALLPIAPIPLPAVGGAEVPAFISTGAWRRYVPPGTSMVAVPLPRPYAVQAMRWSALTGDDLRLAGGYFLGPARDPRRPDDTRAVFTPTPRPTTALWNQAWTDRAVPPVGPAELAAFRADLAYWRAAVIVIAPIDREGVLIAATTMLVGAPPAWQDGVWLWNVHGLADAGEQR
jgi:hypothetical protein